MRVPAAAPRSLARRVLSAADVRAPWNQFFVIQELDSQIDQLREELNLALLLGDQQTAHLDSEIARARREAEAVQTQLQEREEQRGEAAALVTGQFFTHYQRLRRRLKTRPWVVNLRGASCPACNLALPSKMLGDAQRTGEPAPCPSCARLLIWQSAASDG
jgi:predicted  nucleic acid-binding Zn-ribbon protein